MKWADAAHYPTYLMDPMGEILSEARRTYTDAWLGEMRERS